MLWFFLIIALVNAGLCAAAVAVYRSGLLQSLFSEAPANGPSPAPAAATAPQYAREATLPTPPEEQIEECVALIELSAAPLAAREEIPLDWLEMLDEDLKTDSFVEAAAHVVRLDVTRYREELLRIDRALRAEADEIAPAVLGNLQTDLMCTNQDWLQRQAKAVSHLQGRHQESSESNDAPASALEAALVDQAAHIRDVDVAIARHDYRTNQGAGRRKLLYEIASLLDHCHSLRDRTHESLVAVLRREGRLDTLKPALQIDPLTQLRSRASIEMLLENWWRDDPHRHRLASVALIDLDRLSDHNRQWGPLVGDLLISAVAGLARDGFRRNRGYDVVGRFAGQQFFVFLGDTGPHGAATAVERLRQTIQAASFCCDGEEIPVRVSCGLTEIHPADTAVTLLLRTQNALHAAKAADGNQTHVHDGGKPAPVLPPTFSVARHKIRLTCEIQPAPA